MTRSIEKYLNQFLNQTFSSTIHSLQFKTIGGGCINETYEVTLNANNKFFLKINSIARYPGLLANEKSGLEFLAQYRVIRVPAVVACGETNGYQILVLEWIEGGIKSGEFWKTFGEQLAALHRQTWVNNDAQVLFGFRENNYMGSLPQYNQPSENWIDFFRQYRLEPQIKLAIEKRLLQTKHMSAFESLSSRLAQIFEPEKSALLHGDLWSGNFMCDEHSDPVLIDPAVYFGHRSMDLAMSTLFGGFDQVFYEAYNYHFPFPENYREQWEICNLYPLLIHLNLFGRGYLSQIESTLRRFS
ncbi:MAG TPA: fructosamine kinase family protein [Chitinophagaceae bacterium]|nr:fructosamine kinase family protein [Chitinophagaceae bacterium]